MKRMLKNGQKHLLIITIIHGYLLENAAHAAVFITEAETKIVKIQVNISGDLIFVTCHKH